MSNDARYFNVSEPAANLLLQEWLAERGLTGSLSATTPTETPDAFLPDRRLPPQIVPGVVCPLLTPAMWEAIKLFVVVTAAMLAVHFLGKR